MSQREAITANIVELLQAIRDPKPVHCTRDNIEPDKLARTQFPAVIVRTSDESREDWAMGQQREATLTVDIECWVTGTNLDQQLNQTIHSVESALETDPKHGGAARDTQVTSISVDPTVTAPYGTATISATVQYVYKRKTK